MKPMSRIPSVAAPLWLLLALPVTLPAQFMTQLEPETAKAFDAYRQAAEARMDWQAHLAPAAGEVKIAAGGKQSLIEVQGGLIHDWRGATLAPGTTVDQVAAVLQDYANYKTIYTPEVTASRLIRRDGDQWHVFLQLVKKKVLTVTLNSEYQVQYRRLSPTRVAVLSRSTKLSEVSEGNELAAGTGHGFLWRLNSYWLLEARPEGVYIECRSISLSRSIPSMLSWMIRPMVTGVPKESLHSTLEATVRALEKPHPEASLPKTPEGR
jgi:hypothetical protein